MNLKNVCCTVALCGSVALPATAGVTLTAEQVGSDVVFSGGGTLDFTLWTFSHDFDNLAAQISPDFVLLGGNADVYGSPVNFDGPAQFPAAGTQFADSNTGDVFGIQLSPLLLVVPDGYISGDPLSGSMTFNNESFASLGLVPGDYTWTWDGADGRSDFFTVIVAIPAPGALALVPMLLGLASRRRGR